MKVLRGGRGPNPQLHSLWAPPSAFAPAQGGPGNARRANGRKLPAVRVSLSRRSDRRCHAQTLTRGVRASAVVVRGLEKAPVRSSPCPPLPPSRTL